MILIDLTLVHQHILILIRILDKSAVMVRARDLRILLVESEILMRHGSVHEIWLVGVWDILSRLGEKTVFTEGTRPAVWNCWGVEALEGVVVVLLLLILLQPTCPIRRIPKPMPQPICRPITNRFTYIRNAIIRSDSILAR